MVRTSNPFRHRRRTAFSSVEVLVAFTLLTTVLGVSTALIVRHGRLLASQRDYRIALDELSSQLDRLTALPHDERALALENLVPSSFTAEKLPGATIRGEIADADLGQRITLRLHWDEPRRNAAPIVLSGWSVAQGESSDQPSEAGDRP